MKWGGGESLLLGGGKHFSSSLKEKKLNLQGIDRLVWNYKLYLELQT